MKEKVKQIIDTKQFHICMVALIVIAILFVVGVVSLKYNVEGEENLPFYVSKISIISNVEGFDVEDIENNRATIAILKNPSPHGKRGERNKNESRIIRKENDNKRRKKDILQLLWQD